MKNIKVIAFDADDTLWVNEPFFQKTERRYCEMLEDYLPHHTVSKELLKVEIVNMSDYGFGAKAFMLSMIENAINISNGTVPNTVIQKTIELGKELINHEIELIEGIEEVLKALQGKYRLVMATKGDLLDQEKKLLKSGLEKYFHHIEIVSDKTEEQYKKLISHLDIKPQEFLMIGNSLKSDVIPVLNIGGFGFHVPYHTTWEHEKIDISIENERFRHLKTIREVLDYIS